MTGGRIRVLARRYGLAAGALTVATVVAVAALLASGVAPVQGPRPVAGSAALAPGSAGSLPHYHWWDPRGWFGGHGAALKPRTIAAVGGPQVGRAPAQAAWPAPRRVRELTARRSADARVYQLSDGRRQAVISAVPVNYRDARGAWRPVDTAVRPSARAGYAYANLANTFRSFFGNTAGRLVRFEPPGGGFLSVGLDGGHAGRPVVAGDTVTYRGVWRRGPACRIRCGRMR